MLWGKQSQAWETDPGLQVTRNPQMEQILGPGSSWCWVGAVLPHPVAVITLGREDKPGQGLLGGC